MFTANFWIQVASEKRLFEGLYLKIRTNLRAAQRYPPRIAGGEPVYLRNRAIFVFKRTTSSLAGRQKHSLSRPQVSSDLQIETFKLLISGEAI